MSWTLADMRTKFRSLTGRPSMSQISNANIDSYINDFYRFDLCEELEINEVKADWSTEATVSDNGEYSIDEEVIDIQKPFFANDDELTVIFDKQRFFADYPDVEDYITSPSLVIGTSDTKKVKNGAFKYKISGWIYSKASAETALSGSTIPQNKYGAFLIEIDSAGTITITGSGANGTGYLSAALAVNGLPAQGTDKAVMGYLTIVNTNASFVPGTTALNASGVTTTYTNGDPKERSTPSCVLLDLSGGKIYVRPKVNDTYLLKSKLVLQRPTTLSLDTDEPLDTKWGQAIVYGAAMKCLTDEEFDEDKIQKLKARYDYEMSSIERKILRQISDRDIRREW